MVRATVVLAGVDDEGFSGALTELCGLSGEGLLHPLVLVRPLPEDHFSGTEISAERLSAGEFQEVELFGELQGSESLSRIDVVTACTASLGLGEQSALGERARELRGRLEDLASAKTSVRDHRVFFPEHGSVSPTGRFFDSRALSNLIVIAEDREFEGAFARSISAASIERFRWHVAVELASIVGLWASMDHPPIDNLEATAAGVPGIIVRLIRSIVRTAISTHPAIEDVFGGDRPLPTAVGFVPAPDQAEFTSKAARAAYHHDFRSKEPQGSAVGVSHTTGRVLKMALGRIGTHLVRTPQRARAALRRQVADTVEDATKVLVFGDFSDNEVADAAFQTDSERAIAELNEYDPPLEFKSMDQSWDQIIEDVLGVIDGSSPAEPIRDAAGGIQYVTTERTVLVPEPGSDIRAAIDAVCPDDVRRTGQSPPAGTIGDRSQTDADHTEGSEPAPRHPGLLRSVTQLFTDEAWRVKKRYEDFMARLDGLKSVGHSQKKAREKATRWGKLLSSLILLFAVTCLTEFGDYFALKPPFFDADLRFRLFVGFSGLIAIPISFLFLPLGDRPFGTDSEKDYEDDPAPTRQPSSEKALRPRQASHFLRRAVHLLRGSISWLVRMFQIQGDRSAYLFCYLTGILVPTVFLTVFAPSVREPITDTDVLRWLLGVMTACAVAAGALIGMHRMWRFAHQGGTLSASDRLAYKLTKYGGCTYLILAAIVRINRYRDSTPDSFWDSGRLLVTLLVIAAVMGTTSLVSESVGEIRNQLERENRRKELRYLKSEALEAKRGKELAEVLRVQWVGTATVLARLIWWPFGRPLATADRSGSHRGRPSQVRKFRKTTLELSEVGRMAFLDKAAPMVREPGYLVRQQKRISDAYVRQQEKSNLAQGRPDQFTPEHGTYPAHLEDALLGKAKGHRWAFAYQVAEGEFDNALSESLESELSDALLETFLEVPNAWKPIEGEALSEEGLATVFSKLAPPSTVDLPKGSLGKSAAVQLGGTTMDPYIWWPRKVDPPGLSSAEVRISPPINVGNQVILQAVRVDISSEILLSTFGSEVGPPLPTPETEPSMGDQEAQGGQLDDPGETDEIEI